MEQNYGKLFKWLKWLRESITDKLIYNTYNGNHTSSCKQYKFNGNETSIYDYISPLSNKLKVTKKWISK